MRPRMRLTLGHIRSYVQSHRRISVIILFLVAWIAASYIFYRRFPQNFEYANFFAEDGDHFTANIMQKGFVGSLLTPFNGYFIFGIYLLKQAGFVVNSVLFHGQFADLPASLALVSYGFLGLCAALPVVLLRSYLRWQYRIALVLLIALLPLPSFDYGTIGTIGNLKFPFVYICFLLVLYRLRLSRSAKRVFLIDALLAVGMFTTAGCYIALPFILLSRNMLPQNVRTTWKRKNTWLSLIRRDNYALWSFVGLAALACVQILYVAVHGTPELPGYLDEPYQWRKTIEVFIARPYLYPFISSVYHHLRGIFVLSISGLALFLVIRYGAARNRYLYVFGIVTIFFTTAVFIYNRTGVSFYYDHYRTSGFDNFYYTQNFIALVLGMVLLADIAAAIKWRPLMRIGVPVAIVLLTLSMARTNQTYAPNDFMQYQIRPLKTQLAALCTEHGKNVMFSVYPFTFLHMTVPHDTACTPAVSNSHPTVVNYGLYTKSDKILALKGTKPQFYQSFIAKSSNLHEIGLYVSTYYQSQISGYRLNLMDAACRNVLKDIALPRYVRDNAYLTIAVDAKLSKGTGYCFTVYPTSSTAPPLALQFAQPINSTDVTLRVNGQVSDRSITFALVY